MGSGGWTADTHASRAAYKSATNTPNMAYSSATKSKGVKEYKVHEDLDPKKVNNDGAHKDQNIRESLDSIEHPNSVAVAILFDETGSMQHVPEKLVTKLPDLWGLILRKGYVEDPQLLFGGIGDAYSDRVPLQVAQFESDNRSDEDLEKIFLEGNGGGGGTESYELAMYFMARHTYIDCFEKREKRGYLFIIGDEMPYDTVSRSQVENIIGDKLQADIPTTEIMAELQEKFDVYLIRPLGGGYRGSSGAPMMKKWKTLLDSQNIIELDDDEAVSEIIALTIGLAEGVVGSLDDALADLTDIGASEATKMVVSRALATVGSGGSVAISDAPEGLSGDDSVERL